MKHIIFLLIISITFLTSCNSTTKYSYDYMALEKIAINLKQVYTEMNTIYYSDKNRATWENSRENFISQLDTIQEAIDELPPVEKDPKEKGAKQFNDLLYTPRSISNQLQNIEYLLYDTANNDDFKYFETVIQDTALEARLDNLVERCEKRGQIIPLATEYQNIQPPETDEEADITIEFSNIKSE